MLDWSHSRLTPFTHQKEDVQTLLGHPFFFIMSEMRTGKTKIVIDAAQFMYVGGIIDRVIVVAPAPVRDVWFDRDLGELQKHLWKLLSSRVTEYHAIDREWQWGDKEDDQLEWIVTNYEFLRSKQRLAQLLSICSSTTLLVLDESSFIKTWNAKQTEACFELRKHCGRIVILNGTPISHSPLDLFSQANILDPSILECRYITHFKARYAEMATIISHGKALKDKWGREIQTIAKWKNLDDLQRRLKPYSVRRLQKECLDLPEKLDPVSIAVPLDATTWNIYREMRDECVVMFEGGASAAAQAVVKTIRLAQITSGFIGGVRQVDLGEQEQKSDWMKELNGIENCDSNQYTSNNNQFDNNQNQLGPIKEIGREKLDMLLWFLGHRLEQYPDLHIVVWCRFRLELERMLRAVSEKFPQFEVGTIHGGQKKVDRQRAMNLLHPDTSPKGPVFVGGTFGTGSFGLNFTAANHSMNMSYDYSLGKFKQSGDRVYGPGMIGPAAYFDMVATGPKGQKTIDHIIVKARREREDVANWTASAWVKALREE